MNGHEDLGLVLGAVNALADSYELHAGEIQARENRKRILRAAREARGIVHQNRVERARGRKRGIEQARQVRAVRTGAAQSFVAVDMRVEDLEAVRPRVLAAFPNLVIGRERVLLLGGDPGIDGGGADWSGHRWGLRPVVTP
ncbi:MAG TPA: hypothetical protein VJW51_04600 [Candidatus Acidoferrales bacterium]|nr:hypothetical protein [Candidatus Acidoferrales bacterium]